MSQLHCSVSSLERHEPPHAEPYVVPASTVEALHKARQQGGRVIAVGTTVLRALETAVDEQGQLHAREGWTNLLIKRGQPIRSVDGLFSGFHPPEASHVDILLAMLSSKHLIRAYQDAAQAGYLCHEFGDLHLMFKTPSK